MKALFSLFWVCLWGFSISILLSLIFRLWIGDSARFTRITGYIMPWLLLGLLPGILIAWIDSHKLLAFTLFASSLIIGISYLPIFLNCLQPADSNRASIKVMSHNIWKNNHNPKAAIELIRREQPDILLLQEIYIDVFQKFLKDLNHLYTDKPLQYEYIPEIKQAVISRFPIIPVSTNIEKGRAQIVRIETSFGPITVINVHIYKWPWYRRQRQIIELVTEDISKNYGPIVLGGDFNTNDQSKAYRVTEKYLKNAHWESGCGFGFTFPTPELKIKLGLVLPALIRIDHIFYSKHFYSRNSRTLNESGGSDHYPVIAELIPNFH